MQVLLGCDGGGLLGIGHVMRSLALAEAAVVAGHEVVVAGHFEGGFLQGQLAAAPVTVARLSAGIADGGPQPLIDLAGRLSPDVLHIDSYQVAGMFAEQVASSGLGALVSNMEDGTFGRRSADVVIDPTLGAELSARPPDRTTWLLRGSRYMPLRQRVIDAARPGGWNQGGGVAGQPDDPVAQVARSVLVVMGGTDPVGLTPAIVGLLARTGLALEVTAIATAGNAERVRTAAKGSLLSLTILGPVDDLAALMSAHDLVVSAAGTSIWELCCVGVPAAVVWAVDNQREGYDRVVSAGAAIGLGGPEVGGDERAVDLLTKALTDRRVRRELVQAGRSLVDELGAWRVVRMWEQAVHLRALPPIGAAALIARPATLQDSRRLWRWRNDPATRAGSRSSAEVPWEDHLGWLKASLTRTDRILLVIEDSAGAVGTVRWDLVERPETEPGGGQEWEVSVTMAPQRRGQLLARPLLRAAESALSELARSGGSHVSAYLAVVHIGNRSSTRLFETSAYVPDLPPDQRGFMRFRKAARVT